MYIIFYTQFFLGWTAPHQYYIRKRWRTEKMKWKSLLNFLLFFRLCLSSRYFIILWMSHATILRWRQGGWSTGTCTQKMRKKLYLKNLIPFFECMYNIVHILLRTKSRVVSRSKYNIFLYIICKRKEIKWCWQKNEMSFYDEKKK